MKRNEDILSELLRMSQKEFPDKSKQIEEKSKALLREYCKEEEGKPKEITMHTVKKIFPCIAFYLTVVECTGQREKAIEIINEYFTVRCSRMANVLRKLCSIPFIYHLVPRVMAGIIHKTFGTKSGFEMIDHSVKGNLCHIDMIKCPYFDNCVSKGCPELTKVFCNGDDISYGNMHHKLSWERTKTLGRKDSCCDFILRVKK